MNLAEIEEVVQYLPVPLALIGVVHRRQLGHCQYLRLHRHEIRIKVAEPVEAKLVERVQAVERRRQLLDLQQVHRENQIRQQQYQGYQVL